MITVIFERARARERKAILFICGRVIVIVCPLPTHASIQDYGGLLSSSLLPINKSPGERQDAHTNEERNADGYHHFRPCWVPAECDLSFGHAVLQPRDNGVLLVSLVVPGAVA